MRDQKTSDNLSVNKMIYKLKIAITFSNKKKYIFLDPFFMKLKTSDTLSVNINNLYCIIFVTLTKHAHKVKSAK